MSVLKVWVDGKERVIQGVSEGTTSESIILVLAKAAEKSGKLALLEKWRDFERILSADENPVMCLDSWGSYKNEVSLQLQYDQSNSKSNTNSIKLIVDDKVLKDSIDYESLEDLTSLQQLKLNRLERRAEILDFQCSCWDGSEEAFLYLTEDEIIEDLSVKLSQALKLQAKELVEFETWNSELKKLEQNRQELVLKREITEDKIENLETQIAENYDAVEDLLQESKKMRYKEEEMVTNSRDNSEVILEELDIVTRELSKQNMLFHKQEQDLKSIVASLSATDTSLRRKTNEVQELQMEIEKESNFYDILDDFRPQIPEAESKAASQEIRQVNEFSDKFEENRQSLETPESEISKILENQESGSKIENGNRKIYAMSTSNDDLSNENVSKHLDVPRSESIETHSNLHLTSKSKEETDGQDLNEVSVISNSPTKHLQMDTATPFLYSRPILSSTKTSELPSQRKESFKKLKESFESSITQNTPKDGGKPPTKPKPKTNHNLAPKLQKTTPLSTQTSVSQDIVKTTRDTFKFITAPKPYSSSIGTQFKGVDLLSHRVDPKYYLRTPTASEKLSYSKISEANSGNDLAEQGVFV